MAKFMKHLFTNNSSQKTQWKPEQGRLYDLHTRQLDGRLYPLDSLRGKTVAITNVACDCGYTKSGYENLINIKNKYSNKPFEIIAFPSDSFNQEGRSAKEIHEFVHEKFPGINFPLMEKSEVNGPYQSPVYTFLKQSFPGDISWNFGSVFVVNKEGIPVSRLEKQSWSAIEQEIGRVIFEDHEQEEDKPN